MPNKIKLAVVSNVAAPYRVSQHQRIARELGDEVELWSFVLFEHDWQPWEHELPPEIRPIVFGKGESAREKSRHPLRQWAKMSQVIRTIQEKQIDMVITTGANDLGLLRLITWCRRHDVPNFIFGDSNILGDTTRGWRRLVKNWYVGYAARSVTGFLPCGSLGKEFFERYGGSGKPYFFMPHEPDYAKIFSVSQESRNAVREEFGLQADRKVIIFSGRLAAVKRVDTLIDAFVKIADERPDWDLLIVGSGPLEEELLNRVPGNLKDRIIWTGFINDRDTLSALYTCAEVFVLPSSYEPWAVVVCEAAAAGLAIFTSEVVGAGAELCRDGMNGGTFPVGDVARLVEQLLYVTEHPDRLAATRLASLQVLDDWRRHGDPVQGVRLAMATVGLLDDPPPVEPDPPTPTALPACDSMVPGGK